MKTKHSFKVGDAVDVLPYSLPAGSVAWECGWTVTGVEYEDVRVERQGVGTVVGVNRVRAAKYHVEPMLEREGGSLTGRTLFFFGVGEYRHILARYSRELAILDGVEYLKRTGRAHLI